MPTPGSVARTALVAALLLTAACSDTSGTEATPTAVQTTWGTSTDPVAADGLVWATGSTVHLSDDTTIDVGGPLMTYVVAGDGVYFTPAESDEAGTQHGNMTTGPLHFAEPDGTVTDTGLVVYVESLGSSPTGRYLGLVDATSGPEDDFSDYPQATAVIIDLSTGERVVDSTEGMGDVEEDDLAHDYPEVYLGVRFPDDDSAFVEGMDGLLYALPGGEGEVVDAIDAGVRSPLDRTSPDGAWAIDDRGSVEVLLSADGERVKPRTGTARWDLGWWLDADTILGFAPTAPGAETLITCEVPGGECRSIEGTEGGALRFPVDTSPNDAVNLRGEPA